MSNTFLLNRGSDFRVVLTWPSAAGGAANLTGCTVSLFEPQAVLVGLLTAQITNAAAGEITLAMEWSAALLSVHRAAFRVRVSYAGGLDQTTNELVVQFQ